MAQQVLEIRKGDSDVFTETITGLASLSGYTAKMYIYNTAGTLITSATGAIDGLTASYTFLNNTTKAWTLGRYNFETKLFDASDHVYTPSYGKFVVLSANNTDPS